MGRRPKQTVIQKRHTDGLQTHEKMFNIADYQRNASQNYSGQNGVTKKSLQITKAGQGVEEREPSQTFGGDENWYSFYGKQCGGSLKS